MKLTKRIAIGNEAIEQTLTALVRAVDEMICPIGFNQTDRNEWERKGAWKIEEIDLGVKEGLHYRVLPSFRILLPRTRVSELGDEYQYIAQDNVCKVLRPDKNAEYVKVPRVSLGAGRFVRSIVTDIKSALPWFDQFATPELCKANLGKFLKPGCPAYVDAEEFLSTLVRAASSTHDA